ncbi:MAG: glycosyltransferase [Clostridia bacterium]|nr:glycosyltransferase [Clostridia bacterium]
MMLEANKKIRVLEVVDNYYPNTDGVVLVVDNYAKLLNKEIECSVLAPKYSKAPKQTEYELIECISLNGGIFGPRLALPHFDIKLHKYLKTHTFDLIHVHSPATLAKYIISYAKKRNIPIVFTAHTKYHVEINRFFKTKFFQKLFLNYTISAVRKSDYIWAVSDGVRDVFKNEYLIDKEYKVFRNGTDMDISYIDDRNILKIKLRYNINENDFVIVTAGRIVSIKNFQILVEAVHLLHDTCPNVKLIIIGDGNYKKTLENMVKEYNLEENIFFVGKTNDRKELATYYYCSNITALASTFDTSSLIIKEGFAFSKPTLVVANSAPAEGIIDNQNSYLAECDANSFAEKIKYIISNRDKYNEVCENCYNSLYTPWKKITPEVLKEYLNIIEEKNN